MYKRQVPEGAEVDISMLPGGNDELIVEVGEYPAGWEHLGEKSKLPELPKLDL